MNKNQMVGCIIAGGKGTRITDVSTEIPKALLPIGGVPIVERQIQMMSTYGIKTIFLFVGHLSEQIEAYFGDGSRLGVSIKYFHEDIPLGTAGCLALAQAELRDHDCLIMSGDIMIDMDLGRLLSFHESNKAALTLVIHPNDHPQDSDLIELTETNEQFHHDSVGQYHERLHGHSG